MTTTINRQLTLAIQGVMKKYNIDNLQLEVDLVSILQRMWTEGGKDPVKLAKIREEVLSAWFSNGIELDKMSAMEGRVKDCMGISIDGRTRYDDMVKFLVKKDAEGQTVEQYAKWMMENPLFAPKPFQIAARPDTLIETWQMAFVIGVKPAEPRKFAKNGKRFERLTNG